MAHAISLTVLLPISDSNGSRDATGSSSGMCRKSCSIPHLLSEIPPRAYESTSIRSMTRCVIDEDRRSQVKHHSLHADAPKSNPILPSREGLDQPVNPQQGGSGQNRLRGECKLRGLLAEHPTRNLQPHAARIQDNECSQAAPRRAFHPETQSSKRVEWIVNRYSRTAGIMSCRSECRTFMELWRRICWEAQQAAIRDRMETLAMSQA